MTPPQELRSLDYCMGHKERHIIGHGSTEHHEGTPCEACDYLDTAQETRALFEVQYRRMTEATAMWRAEAPEERELVQPDLGSLLEWLMARAASQERPPIDVERQTAIEHVIGVWANRHVKPEWMSLMDRAVKRLSGSVGE